MIARPENGPLELVVQLAEDAEDARRADQHRGVVDDIAVEARSAMPAWISML